MCVCVWACVLCGLALLSSHGAGFGVGCWHLGLESPLLLVNANGGRVLLGTCLCSSAISGIACASLGGCGPLVKKHKHSLGSGKLTRCLVKRGPVWLAARWVGGRKSYAEFIAWRSGGGA